MADAVICLPLRTPVGRFGGVFAELSPQELGARVISEIMAQSKLDPEVVDECIFGQGYPNGEAPAIGRIAALDAGLGVRTPGMQIDRRCGSGLQAILTGAMEVQTGVCDLVIAGGVDVMSAVEHYALGLRRGVKQGAISLLDRLDRSRITAGGKFHEISGGMIETAENIRRNFAISRESQDRLALQSHTRAANASKSGRFDAEIVEVEVPKRGAPNHIVSRDEHFRPDLTYEALAALRPIMGRSDPSATVTAGNASGQNDAAAACIVTTPETAHHLGLTPLLKLRSWAVAGVEPELMGMGPVPATNRALERAGLSLSDMDLIEINEAFAAQVLGVCRGLDLKEGDHDRINVNGSGISLGHPIGATGARILATMAHEMARRESRYGLETMCIGGGQGLAAVFERFN